MSDWRLVNKEGELVWTSPAVPNGGQNLFTVMSPTLILGCKKKGDAIPVNYVKLPDVTRVSMTTPTGILLERRTGSSILLVCHAGPQEASAWLESIQRAVGGSGSLVASPKAGSKPGAAASTPAAAAASKQQQQPAAAGTPAAGSDNNNNNMPSPVKNATSNTGSSNTAAPPQQDPKLANIATALQNDMKSKPIARPDAAQQQNQQQQQQNNSSITPPAAGSTVQLPVVSGDSASPDPHHPHSAAAPFMKQQQQNQQQPGQGQNQNQQQGNNNPSGAASTATTNTNTNQQPAPLSLAQLSSNQTSYNQTPQNMASNSNSPVRNNNTNQLLGRMNNNNNNNNQNQQQPEFRSIPANQQNQLNSNNNNNNNNNISPTSNSQNQQQQNTNNNNTSQVPAGTVSTPRPGQPQFQQQQSQHDIQNKNPLSGGTPLAAARTEKNQFEVITPAGAGGGYNNNQFRNNNSFNNNNNNDGGIRPIVAPPLGQGQGLNNNNNNNFNNSNNNNSNANDSSFNGSNANANRMTPSFHQPQNSNSNNNNMNDTSFRTGNGSMMLNNMNNNNNNNNMSMNNTSSTSTSLPDGSLMNAARRRGMVVELPATQNVNRTIAPNASAVWKEWRDPNGVLYVLHEGTGTLQRLDPGDDKFQTFYSDEQLDRMENDPSYNPEEMSPQHMEGDTTLDMDSMTVSNLHHYGRAGAAQSGVPYPPIPSGELLREMVVPVPRGQFSPTRRTQVEPLAVPRVADAGYKGKRIHRFTLAGSDDPRVAVVEHQVQSLETEGLKWDPRTNEVTARNAQQEQTIGNVTLRRQWEHVKSVLMQGRYFKKHATTRPGTNSFRYIFLSSDTSWVCSVPTSDVMVKILARNDQMQIGPESQQYFPPDTKAIRVNDIEEVVLGIEVNFLRGRSELDPNSTFVILSRKIALILECGTPEEARFFCDAWNFFLFYSKPEKPARTPQMTAPVTYGTRGGVRW